VYVQRCCEYSADSRRPKRRLSSGTTASALESFDLAAIERSERSEVAGMEHVKRMRRIATQEIVVAETESKNIEDPMGSEAVARRNLHHRWNDWENPSFKITFKPFRDFCI
jgi:hypothetical protein